MANLEPRAACEAKAEHEAEHAAEAGEGAKVVFVARVKQEAKAGLAVTVGAGAAAETRTVMYGARAESGDQSHEVAAVKRIMAKTKKERGAPAIAATVVFAAVRI